MKKQKVSEEFLNEVESLKDMQCELIITSNKSVYFALSSAAMCGVLHESKKVIIGRTQIVNDEEQLVWERIDASEMDNEKSIIESAIECNITDHRIVEKMNCQLALTGRAF